VTSADLAFDDAGSGPAVVLIHGHPFNRSMWAPQVAALRDQYRVIVPDLRGYGDSPVTPGVVTMAELAIDINGLLDRLGIETAALAGLSMGGLVLMELAAAEPGRWWGLCFIATTAQPPSPPDAAARLEMARTAEEQGMVPIAEIMGPRLFGPDPGEALIARITDMMLATNPLGAAAALRGRAQRPDYRPVLRSLRTSSFVCTGDQDGYSTAEVTSELVSCLPDPEVVLLKGAGHLPNLEQTDTFNDHLLAFLARTRPLSSLFRGPYMPDSRTRRPTIMKPAVRAPYSLVVTHSRSILRSSLPTLVSGTNGTIRTSRGYLAADRFCFA
jgi:3-oxoadipate enol-lactonase